VADESEATEKIRFGGMALPNGVLVHGPTSWAVAIRRDGGELQVVARRKGLRATSVRTPLLRGPARLLESFAVLPAMKRHLPAAKLPYERPTVLAAAIGSAVAVRVVRDGTRLRPAAQELLASLLALTPATVALRSSQLAAYHGAEHIAIGTYEHDEARAKEHERCGSHLIGPLVATTAIGNVLAARAPVRWRNAARAVAQLGAVAASTEIFGWMTRHPESKVSQALARPGHELQHRLATAEPSSEQLEVAEAALAACLELERGADST
jgi:uncharacterized protein YqhQ